MIKIDDKFYIDSDSNSYTLKEKDKIQDEKSKKYGEEVFRDRGYYVTLEGVLNGYLKAQTREFVQNNEILFSNEESKMLFSLIFFLATSKALSLLSVATISKSLCISPKIILITPLPTPISKIFFILFFVIIFDA